MTRSKSYGGIRERRSQAVLSLIRDYFGTRAFTSQEVWRRLQTCDGGEPLWQELSQFRPLRVRRLLQRLASQGYLLEAKGAGRSSHIYRLVVPQPGSQNGRGQSVRHREWEQLFSLDGDTPAQVVSLTTLLKSLRKREIALLKELSELRELIEQCDSKMRDLLRRTSV